jgi:tetratricopeptide (TPR) repeat protein
MSLFIRTALLTLCILAATCIIAQTPANSVRSASSALRAGQFDKALDLLQDALKANPRSAQLWTLKGIALSGKGEKSSATEAFRRALNLSPDYLPALEGAAQIAYNSGSKDAQPLLEHILTLRPQDPTSHAMLAVLASRRGDCARAVPHFEQGGDLVDSQPEALQQYGACLVRLKQMDKAIAVFERTLALPNADPNARYRLASLQMMAQHAKDAIKTLAPLLNENRADVEVQELAAMAYEATGNTPEAVRILRLAILADPHRVNLYLDFANIALDHQSYQVGVDMINAGLQAEPKAAALYVARGILYVHLAQYESAEADFAKADQIDPKQSIGFAAEGLAAVQKNDPDVALATVRSKLAKRPNDAFLIYLKADILTQRGPEPGSAEFREATECAKQAIALRPSLAAAHDVLAKLYLQAGENKGAAEQSRKALASDPKDQTALYHLIQALRKSGQTREIPDLLKQLAELRMASTREEGEHNRYKLVEEKAPFVEKPLP